MSGFGSRSTRKSGFLDGKATGQFIDSHKNWSEANPVLLSGQLGIESDTGRLKWGDGRTDWNDLAYRNDVPSDEYELVRSEKDANNIFTVITYKRRYSATIFKTSTLTGGTSPSYTTRTVRYFAEDGQTIISTIVYNLEYDGDGELIRQILD
jgi:hypothetical protein